MNFYGKLTPSSFIDALRRKKKIDPVALTDTKLDRCLTTFDLTALGIGSTLGLGIYVLAGQVASTKAGPAVILSFFVAAVASLFAGLCYAEFGARVPKAGSAYVYSYITVGEFMAFIIGWNLVLEYLIGTASVARGYSGYIDSLVDQTIAKHFREWMPIDIEHLSRYPDFLAFAITITLAFMLSFGVKESTRFNSIFTCMNIVIVLYVVICGLFKADFHNWELSIDEVRNFTSEAKVDHRGDGGFFPFGFSGMMAGAATCFYGFIGFDVIATTGEEAKNPQKSIPIAITGSLFFIFLAYFGVSGVQTLMWPYFDQNNDAPLPYVFSRVGYSVAKWIITVGALAGLSTSLLGAIFPLPRVLYAMATDGLIFKSLANIHPRFKTPVLATVVSGFLAACLAAIFDVAQLADMMSIGTLLAYSLVAISVLILRTSCESDNEQSKGRSSDREIQEQPDYLRQLFNLDNVTEPTPFTASLSMHIIVFSCVTIFFMDLCLVLLEEELSNYNIGACTGTVLSVIMYIFSIVLLARQPTAAKRLSFQVPWVPTIPLFSVAINMYLMMKLSVATWIRFAIWMAIGLSIYAFYGIWNSIERLSCPSSHPDHCNGYSHSASASLDTTHINLESRRGTDGIDSPLAPTSNIIDDKLIKNKTVNTGNDISDVKNYEMKPFMN